jgi:tripartite-type tricarboxylate transporter receptor subunit TctC
VRIVIGFPAGGPLDQHARLWADALARLLGQPVLVDYKAGAGGTVGAQAVATAAPDGHTLLLANTGTMVINPALYRKLPYDTLNSFVPVARTAQQPLALLVHPEVPARTLPEFVALLKAHPGRYNYGSAGNGGISHLVPEMLKTRTGTFMVHIPYRGSAPAFTDLIAGQVQFMAESIPQAAQYARAGKVRGGPGPKPERQPPQPPERTGRTRPPPPPPTPRCPRCPPRSRPGSAASRWSASTACSRRQAPLPPLSSACRAPSASCSPRPRSATA